MTDPVSVDLEALKRLAAKVAFGGPHEWGYRDQVAGVFISDDWPFRAADALPALIAELEQARGEIERRGAEQDMLAFGASETACYLYPAEHQQPERDAFREGAARAGIPLSTATFDRLKAAEAVWIKAATTNLVRAETAEAALQDAQRQRDEAMHYAKQSLDEAVARQARAVKAEAERDQLRERVERLEACISALSCPSCGGSGEYRNRGRDLPPEGELVRCKICEGTGKHPLAWIALSKINAHLGEKT